jgi:hypothetical protein
VLGLGTIDPSTTLPASLMSRSKCSLPKRRRALLIGEPKAPMHSPHKTVVSGSSEGHRMRSGPERGVVCPSSLGLGSSSHSLSSRRGRCGFTARLVQRVGRILVPESGWGGRRYLYGPSSDCKRPGNSINRVRSRFPRDAVSAVSIGSALPIRYRFRHDFAELSAKGVLTLPRCARLNALLRLNRLDVIGQIPHAQPDYAFISRSH